MTDDLRFVNNAPPPEEADLADGDSSTGPLRAPPTSEFVLFSESARSVVACVELNSTEGLFVGPANPRHSSLAVIEAIRADGSTCEVRFIGRVTEHIRHPSNLVRVRWVRAVSHLPPVEFVNAVEACYGFVLNINAESLDPEPFANGSEYDFTREQLLPHGLDSARGDTSRRKRREHTPPKRRYKTDDGRKARDQMGIATTQTFQLPRTKTPDKNPID